MAKSSSVFMCSNCGAPYARWQGKCNECDSWNTLEEQKEIISGKRGSGTVREPLLLKSLNRDNFLRIKTGSEETDRVLGGGIVPGSLILIGGDPGIGKSTLVLQTASNLSKNNRKILYVSGEESPSQIKIRSDRLKANEENIYVLGETEINDILKTTFDFKPDVLIVDSIQTVYASELSSAPGNVSQISYITGKILEFCKKTNIASIIIGHVTKEGAIAGPRVLEHLVDVVLYLEGDRYGHFRVLRGVKNRFGSTNESGIFEMVELGLVEVKNPSLALLSERSFSAGSVVFPAMEGTRPMLVEVQALTSITPFGYPARKTSGFDANRLQLLSTVLTKRSPINLSNQDVYVNIIGGLNLKEPALDLPIILSIASSFKNTMIDKNTVALGEIGLSGEIRSVNNIDKRLKEAEKLGFKKAIVGGKPKITDCKLQIESPKTIAEALKIAF
ncbi:DNA repair protein RadA [bacterium CG2_30_37_16]|nr:MAG: DNA repair protein RadA [bacterium CG2_30_37_16]PIP30762.1 MAG: DNA repair protein RadA [bacterium (Candidatus Howlettbacteria) CG23_combo_of_CG06-09_8_20_14_all_37_9]PJB05489.1 MAG: DNA repair protein RadA [bacterium (Candidatus Howlettbacteria) CG_4_9_14_3_um_filter_37_10]